MNLDFDILSTGQIPTIVPELKDWWSPRTLDDFHYISPELRKQYLQTLRRHVAYCERRIDEDPSMRQDRLVIIELIEELSAIPAIATPADRTICPLADELVKPQSSAKDEFVVAFDDPSDHISPITHMGRPYSAKVLMAEIDLEVMLIGPVDDTLPSDERGRISTIGTPHRISRSWTMRYETFAYYYARRHAIDDHLRLFKESPEISNTSRINILEALKAYFDNMSSLQ